jgi:hypothetical protein
MEFLGKFLGERATALASRCSFPTPGSPVLAGKGLVEWMGRKSIAYTTKLASDSFAGHALDEALENLVRRRSEVGKNYDLPPRRVLRVWGGWGVERQQAPGLSGHYRELGHGAAIRPAGPLGNPVKPRKLGKLLAFGHWPE